MNHELGSSLFWLLFSIYVLIESFLIGIGAPTNPGGGFFAFCVSGILGICSFIPLLQAIFKKEPTRTTPLFFGVLWKRVLFVLAALLIYTAVMPLLGYLISTFFMLFFLFWVLGPGRMRWIFWSLIGSLLTTGISYYLFSVLLNCQFPSGLLGS